MSEANLEHEQDGRGVIETLQSIKHKTLNPHDLSISDRQACVEYMGLEGYSTHEIAAILKVSDRTIRRDRQSILEANAIHPDPNLMPQTVGRLMTERDASISKLRRIVNDKKMPASVKVDAIKSCYDIIERYTKCLQRLGYLTDPTCNPSSAGGEDQALTDQLQRSTEECDRMTELMNECLNDTRQKGEA